MILLDNSVLSAFAVKIFGIKLTGALALLKYAHTKSLIDTTELKKILQDLKMKDKFRISVELESWVLSNFD